MVIIHCNGQQREIDDGSTVAEFIKSLGFDLETVVVEMDGNIVKPEEYSTQKLASGSQLELIRFVGGG